MDTRQKIIISIVVVAASFSAGRFSAPTKVETKTEVVKVEIEKKERKSDTDKTTVEVVKPDGTKITRTETKRTTETKTDTKQGERTTDTKLVEGQKSPVTISALGAINIGDPAQGIIYGASVSRPMIGPIAVGIFGLTNGTVGLSIGLQF
jgi:hypothetical protein